MRMGRFGQNWSPGELKIRPRGNIPTVGLPFHWPLFMFEYIAIIIYYHGSELCTFTFRITISLLLTFLLVIDLV